MCLMNPIHELRKRLQLSQAELGDVLGLHQSAISQYEKGLTIPKPEVVGKLIEFALTRGVVASYDAIYAPINQTELTAAPGVARERRKQRAVKAA